MASTPSPSRVTAMASMLFPVKVLPFSSKDMVTITGSSVFSFIARTAALTSYRFVIVSMAIMSAPMAAAAFASSA